MGMYAIKMPDIGEGIAEVELVEWRVKPGDTVKEDQILADVMTDKATVEIPSPVSGTVAALGGSPGQVMAVGAELIRLEVAGEGNLKDGDAAKAPAAIATTAVQPAAVPATAATAATSAEPGMAAATAAQALERPRSMPAPMRAPEEKPMASPAVRHRAWDLGIELQFVHGSGPAGRILHEDLDVYMASRGQPMAASPTRGRQRHGEEAIAVIGLRRKIAQKMQEAKRRIPHFSYVEEIDVTALESLRTQLNARYAPARGKLTLLPLIARAVIMALEEFPQMNARFDDDAGVVTRHAPVHLGIATQTDAGLMVPVLRHAEALGLWEFGREVVRLADAT
ncbi:MAG: 2-oxo acid dehydrogenase subunit E2, partial [Burkholderiales bacterium]